MLCCKVESVKLKLTILAVELSAVRYSSDKYNLAEKPAFGGLL